MTPKGELSRPGQQQVVEQPRQTGSQVEEVPVVPVVPVVVVAVVAGGQAARPDEVRSGLPAPSGLVTCDSRQRKISAETVLRSHGPPPEGGNFWT